MNVNLSVWGYYPDKYFVDPLYLPYIRANSDDGTCTDCPYNPYINRSPDYGYTSLNNDHRKNSNECEDEACVNKDGYRKNLGMSFQLLHPDKDKSCPLGWIRGKEGWCFRQEPNWEGDLYKKNGFLLPKKEYWEGYTKKDTSTNRTKILNNFDQKSVSLQEGKYISYSTSRPYKKRYNKNPSSYNFFTGH